jgi:AsmA protein
MRKRATKILKITGISLVGLLLLMVLLPALFPNAFSRQIKALANENITGRLDFASANLSFFTHFPHLTLTLKNYSLTGAAPFEKDTLISGQALGFGIDLFSVFRSTVKINRLFIDESDIKVQIDKNGNANYNILKPSAEKTTTKSDTASANIRLEGLYLNNCQIDYTDHSVPMAFHAEQLNYVGKGDLQSSQFDLKSKLSADHFSFIYDELTYINDKPLRAELITGINTSSLVFKFQKNQLMLNQLPVEFIGSLAIKHEGYDIDLHLVSGTTEFGNIFSVLPPEYNQWFASTSFQGASQVTASMTGVYNTKLNLGPELRMDMRVKDGSIRHQQAPVPLEHFNIAAHFRMPGLNTDSTELIIDTLNFNVGNGKTDCKLLTKGLTNLFIDASIKSDIDLGSLQQSLAIPGYELAGSFNADIKSRGVWNLAKQELPIIKGVLQLQKGKIKTPWYPQAIQNISMATSMECNTGKMEDARLLLQPVSFVFEEQPFELQASLENFNDLVYDLQAKGVLDLGKIYQVFRIKEYNVSGRLDADLHLKGTQADASAGRVEKLSNMGTLKMQQVYFSSVDFPYPFEIPSGTLEVENEKAWLRNTTLRYNANDFLLNGYAAGFAGYYLQNKPLTLRLTTNGRNLVVNDFMPVANTLEDSAAAQPTATGVVMLPGNIDFVLQSRFDNIQYNQNSIKAFSGTLQLRDSKLDMQQTKFSVAGAKVNMDGSYAPVNNDSARFSIHLKADSFDIKRAYNEVPLFRELASSAAYASGLVSVDYQLKGALNKEMMPVYPSIAGGGEVKLEEVQVKGMKLFGAVSKATGKDSVNNPKLKAVVVRSTIANNIISIERTKMKVFGFRPRLEGKVSLDGDLWLKFRLGLPPFGIIGIPMTVTGTSENPKVRMSKNLEELDAEDPEEEP